MSVVWTVELGLGGNVKISGDNGYAIQEPMSEGMGRTLGRCLARMSREREDDADFLAAELLLEGLIAVAKSQGEERKAVLYE